MSKFIEFPRPKPKTEVVPPTATFKDFFFQNMTGDLTSASKTLEILLSVDAYTARQYTNAYHAKGLVDPMLTMKTLEIKEAIDNGHKLDAIVAIQYCFSVSMVEAITIFTTLSKY